MQFLKIVFMQSKLNMKDAATIGNLILSPILIVIALEIAFQILPTSPISFAVKNSDYGILATQMLEQLDADIIFIDGLDEGLLLLQEREVAAVFEITENFSQMLESGNIPRVNIHQRETRNLRVFESQIQQFIQEQARLHLFAEQGIDYERQEIELKFVQDEFSAFFQPMTNRSPVSMTLWMLFMNSSRIAKDLSGLKSSKVLERLKTTKNKDFMINIIFCISYFFAQTLLLTINMAIFKVIFNYELGNLLNLSIALTLMNLISISFGIVLGRIFKNSILIENAGLVIGLAFLGLGIVGIEAMVLGISESIRILSQFSPFYWANDMVFNGNVFPGVFVLTLMNLVLLTAGTLKRDQFLQ